MFKWKGAAGLAACVIAAVLIFQSEIVTQSSAMQLPSNSDPSDSMIGLEAQDMDDMESVFLPYIYDPRILDTVPAVKNQGSYGTCWALAAATALEASAPEELCTEFSADHMALNNGFVTELSDGGDYIMIMAYLSSWQGPVTEEEDPYGDAVSPSGLTPSVHVQEIRMIPEDTPENNREEIKEAVWRYGAVQTSLYLSRAETAEDQDYYQSANSAYYYPEEQVQNHDIVILGWDDTYSRYHFKQTPPIDGAYICQNSWGSSFGEDGIFYVSYADANIGRSGLVYSRIESTDNYQAIYQTDECGWQGQQGYADETCWFANVYTAGDSEDAPETAASAAATEEKSDGEISAAATEEKSDGEISAAATEEKSDGGVSAAATEEKSDGEISAAAIEDESDGEASAAATKEESGGEASAAAPEGESGGEASDTASEEQSESVRSGGASDGDGIELAAYGFYATGADTSYELYLVHDFEGTDSFAKMEFLQSGTLPQPGYYTVDLEESQTLQPGERFAVVVKITTPGAENPVAVEYRSDTYTQNVITDGKEGYLSQTGSRWEYTEQKFGSNVCLKAYTK